MASDSAVSAKCYPAIPELFAPVSRCVNCYRKTSDLYAESKSKGEGHAGKDVKGEGQSKAHKKKENIYHKTKSKEEGITEKVGDRKAMKRCMGCWMMTYCDKTCQREHWVLVHRYHCDYLSGKKVSHIHNESSCEDCIAQKITGKDELLDINSPKTGCKFKEESKLMKRELGKRFEFHEDGHNCNCGNEFACEHPFPMGNIQGNVFATALDEMMIHAAKLSNAFIVKSMKAKEKETIAQLLDLHKSILDSRVILWVNVLIYGNVIMSEWIRDMLKHSKSKVEDKIDIENPWWKALKFSIGCIREMVFYEIGNMELIDSAMTSTKLSEKVEFCKENIKNVASISENKLWHRFKLWPAKMGNSLVLLLPSDVFCKSCNADLSDRVVGPVGTWDPSNPLALAFPSLFAVVTNNGGIAAACSPVQNFDCGKEYLVKLNARGKFNEEEKEEYKALLEKTRKCHLCLKLSLSSHRCINCLAVQYCSMECAKRDFAFHKTVCFTWAEDPTRRLMSSSNQKELMKTFVARMPMWTNETKKTDKENL